MAETQSAQPSATKASHWALFILTLGYILNYMDRQIVSVLLQPIKETFGVSDSMLGLLSGFSFAVVYSTLGIPLAMMADRFNRRNIIAGSLFVFSLMTALCGMASSFMMLLLARLGVGVGEAGTSPPSHSIISDLYPPHQRATALAVYALGVNLGLMAGFFGAGYVAEHYGWREAFLLAAAPGLLLAVLMPFVMSEPVRGQMELVRRAPRAASPFFQTVKYMWTLPAFRQLSIGAALNALVGYGSIAWTYTFLLRTHGMGYFEAGQAMALLYGLVGGVGTVAGGILADRLGRRDNRWRLWIMVIANLISIPFSLIFLLHSNVTIGLAAYAIPILLGAVWLGPTFALTQSLAPVRMRSSASALLLFIINMIGLGLGPWSIGFVSDLLMPSLGENSLRWALILVGGVYLWASVHFILAGRTLDRDLKTVADDESAQD